MSELTVGQLWERVAELPSDMPVTFGSSRHSLRPLIFYRFKRRGEDLLHIELNELDPDLFENESELGCRITVGDLRDHLRHWSSSDRITFGSTIDGTPLVADEPSVVFSFNLDQPDPRWL